MDSDRRGPVTDIARTGGFARARHRCTLAQIRRGSGSL